METIRLPFGNIVVSDQVPKGTIYIVPPVTRVHYENLTTGEVKEYFEFDPKGCAVITNVGGAK